MLNALTLHKKVNNKYNINMKKKFTQFRWLVTMILFVTAMAMPKMAWAQISLTKPSSGDGSSANPYQIGTPEELYWFAALVNGKLTDGTSQNTGACAVLVKDITVNENLLSSKLDENGEPIANVNVQSWTPIGYYISSSDYVYYKGTFDGNGYSISGLYVKDTDKSYVSFIGDIEKGCVKNIAILDSYFEGSMIIGGIVGYLNGGIINNCLFSGTVKSKDKVGGICGGIQGYSTISDCFSNAKILVDNADNYCGGICGQGWDPYPKLRNCVYNYSLYTGEAIKWNSNAGTVEHITGMETTEIASGKATHWLNRYQFGDGSIGWHQNIDNGQTNDTYPVLDNTHGVVYTSQPCPSSGIFSNTKPSSSEVQHSWGENNVCTQCGKTKDVLDLVEGFQEPSQVGGVYQISTAGELYWFTALVNGNGLLTDGTCPNNSANAVLTSDITINTNVLDESSNLAEPSKTHLDWIPIGNSYRPYTGTFDGKGYTVSGLYFNDTSKEKVGLFGRVDSGGKISNVGVLDSYFQFRMQGGGICGLNYGEINNCTNGGTVIANGTGSGAGGVCGMNYGTVKDCKNTGSVSGNVSNIGGVCGAFYSGTIENCLNEGTVSGTGETSKSAYGGVCGHAYGGVIKLSSNTASVSGNNAVGGVCGYNQGATLEDCYNTGAVIGTGNASFGGVCGENSSGYTINCYNTGAVSGKNNVGGVCGQNYGTITNCYYLSGTATGGINGEDATGSAEGKTEAQFNSGEVTYLLNEGKAFGTQVWGQQLGVNNYPVLGSDYKVIRAAKGDKDANGDYPYWATFSNQSGESDLGDMNVYTAKVSEGVLTITRCSDKIVAKGEGVLVKGSTEYLNAKMLNTTSADAEANNDLVATPDETKIIYADSGHKLYRLTYNSGTSELGFYWGLVKNDVGTVISDNGSQLKATPNKAYLKVSTGAATNTATAAPARGFVFPGDDETTGIGEIVIEGDAGISGSANADGRIYNIQGQQVTAPVKGLYIKNNKKVVIK